jgi:hypothetical protein
MPDIITLFIALLFKVFLDFLDMLKFCLCREWNESEET